MKYKDRYKDMSIPISKLHLDPGNPRLSKKGMSEKDIMLELFDEENVAEVIKSICQHDYLPNERLFVVKDKGKNFVMEGNRRLCALKLLENPSLIPGRIKEVASAIGKRKPQIEKEVSVTVMSHEDAKGLILHRHTTNPVRKWEIINQAKVYRELINSGKSVEDIVREYGKDLSTVKKILKLQQLHWWAGKMKLSTKTRAIVLNQREFNSSALDRIAGARRFNELLGISYTSGDVLLKYSIPKAEFVKKYTKIVSDIANKDINTRDINTAKDAQKYLSIFGSPKKSASKKSASNKSAFKKSSKEQHCIIPDDVEFALKNRSLEGLFDELQSMSFESFPNSVALSFRGFLEMSVYEYLEEKGLIEDLNKMKDGKKGMIGLKKLLDYLCKNPEKCGITQNIANAVEKSVHSGADKIFSVHSLNSAVHNPDLFMTFDDLDSIGRNFEKLIRRIVKGSKNN